VLTPARADVLSKIADKTDPHVVRVGVDGPDGSGFWLDSYDHDRFRADVLEPFAPGGDRRYRAVHRDGPADGGA
jgi:hypothetical protein